MQAALLALLFLPTVAGADGGIWVERGDARGLSDGVAQRTLERGPLEIIVGELGPIDKDPVDAFSIRIVDPAAFSVEVEASFDLSWHLLGPDGLQRSPSRPGEHVLVVSTTAPLSSGGLYALHLNAAEGAAFLDVVLAINEEKMDRYCLGTEAAGNFHCHGVSGEALATRAVALADFNGDGELDAVFGTSTDDDASRVCPGDGVGRFSFAQCSDIGAPGREHRDVAVGDLDEDGNIDIVFVEAETGSVACLGDGAFGFSCQPVEADPFLTTAVALGDMDADGKLDAVFAIASDPNRICFGDGFGGFSQCSDVNGTTSSPEAVALGHFNGDGDLDIAFAGQLSRVCLSDGAGGFFCPSLQNASFTTGVAVGLLNDDAHTDLVFTRFLSPLPTDPKVCLGDGSGGFLCTDFGAGYTWGEPTDVALADFDNDGELDAAISTRTEKGAICFGDGAGSFSNCTPIQQINRRQEAIAVGALAPASVGWDDFETGDLRAWASSLPDG